MHILNPSKLQETKLQQHINILAYNLIKIT